LEGLRKNKKNLSEKEKNVRGVAKDTTFNMGNKSGFIFKTTKVPRQFPLVFLVRIG
jgi:hypothetical protein